MDEVFLKLLNMSISASWLVLAVVVVRLLLKNAPKSVRCVLWALVGFRLVCPVSLESVLSLIPSGETVPYEIVYAREPAIDSGVEVINQAVNPLIYSSFAPKSELASVNPIQIWLFVAQILWIAGMAAMLMYALFSYLRLRRRVCASVCEKENVWICDYIDTPFILGLFRPRIYIPSTIDGEDLTYVLAHERAHLSRRDHWWKPMGFLLLSVYWFNPLLWVAYVLLCRDIELACDEKVVKEMGAEGKKAYSQALLKCSVPRRLIAACPLAFGEVGVRERIKKVLSYKKPAFGLIVLAVVVCIALAVCFLTDPKTQMQPETEPTVQSTQPTGQTDDAKKYNSRGVGVGTYAGANVYLRIPNDWEYETVAEEDMSVFGVAFWPKGISEGRVRLTFHSELFAVCGTGLETEEVTLANGLKASLGYYDGSEIWSFMSFIGTPGSYVAQTEKVESWWGEYEDEVMDILGTAELGKGVIREEEAIAAASAVFSGEFAWADGIFDHETGLWTVNLFERYQDSYPIAQISVDAQGNVVDSGNWGITLTATDVTPSGLTLNCTQSGGDIEGELMTGAYYSLERLTDGGLWEEVGVTFNGEYAWTTEGWLIQRDDTTSWSVDWRWLYGELPAGNYRIGKNFSDFVTVGVHEDKAFYAEFEILSVEEILQTIVPGQPVARNPQAYLDDHPMLHELLVTGYKNSTLCYCFGQFLEGGQTQMRGHVMAVLCKEIIGGEAVKSDWFTLPAQDWFDAYLEYVLDLGEEISEEEMKEFYPMAWVLYEMVK